MGKRAKKKLKVKDTHGWFILWKDSASVRGWTHRKEAAREEPMIIRTLGWPITKDKKKVIVALSFDEQEKTNDYLVIPSSCVLHLKQVSTGVTRYESR